MTTFDESNVYIANMQYFLTIDQIRERAKNIHLSMTRLAEMSGVAASTVMKRRNDLRSSTVARLSETLAGEELRLRDYLNSQHPPKATTREMA